jgi:hypothetical protein
MAPQSFWWIVGSLLCGFILFIPIGLAYVLARRIQKTVIKRREERDNVDVTTL